MLTKYTYIIHWHLETSIAVCIRFESGLLSYLHLVILTFDLCSISEYSATKLFWTEVHLLPAGMELWAKDWLFSISGIVVALTTDIWTSDFQKCWIPISISPLNWQNFIYGTYVLAYGSKNRSCVFQASYFLKCQTHFSKKSFWDKIPYLVHYCWLMAHKLHFLLHLVTLTFILWPWPSDLSSSSKMMNTLAANILTDNLKSCKFWWFHK